ncbi:UDP-Glycosyltransferase/glycogen phosphorylase [Hysterangium stoloniferum]|nr:UDP-Glycosyltransferase/glycogen phosphorylase [Hysterangium stoloniferum]
MTNQNTDGGHILMVCAPGWGHLRPLAALASKIVQERSHVVISLLVVGAYVSRVAEEVDRFFMGKEHNIMARIRIISLGGQGSNIVDLFPVLLKNFESCYQRLASSEPLKCASGKLYKSVTKPNLAIVDFFLYDAVEVIKRNSVNHVPILGWHTSNTCAVLRYFGPERLGGLGDVATKALKVSEKTGVSIDDIEPQMFRPTHGGLVHVPGLPPMYDYEFFPQEGRFMQECDGIIATSHISYEAESLAALKGWFSATERPVYVVGPLLPSLQNGTPASEAVNQKELKSVQNGEEISIFLEQSLERHGKHSIVYISFGSVCWPKPEYLWKLIDVLIERQTPFILVKGSSVSGIPPETADKIRETGLGLISAWTPQQMILEHQATGWFVTHCGQNSIMEALMGGVPMITWPLSADQPANAIHLTLTLDVAFELIEVRAGHGLRPLYRGVTPVGSIQAVEAEARAVLNRAYGHEGQIKRRNANALKMKLQGAWECKGDAVGDLKRMLFEHIDI